jgi:flagellar biosynthesis component FlhA
MIIFLSGRFLAAQLPAMIVSTGTATEAVTIAAAINAARALVISSLISVNLLDIAGICCRILDVLPAHPSTVRIVT